MYDLSDATKSEITIVDESKNAKMQGTTKKVVPPPTQNPIVDESLDDTSTD